MPAGIKGGRSLVGSQDVSMPSPNNPVPKTLARVVATADGITTLGRPDAPDVFVTAASDIKGLNSSQIASKLTIPESKTGFTIFTFPTPAEGIASPVYRTDPGFVGFGRTLGVQESLRFAINRYLLMQ